MAATSAAAGAPAGQESGGQHEQTGLGIQITGLAGLDGGPMSREDLGPSRVSRIEAVRMRLVESGGFHPTMVGRGQGRQSGSAQVMNTRPAGVVTAIFGRPLSSMTAASSWPVGWCFTRVVRVGS